MAKIVALDPYTSVAHQLVDADFAEAAARGYRSVVNNRPDGEVPDQLPDAQAAEAASRLGLEYRYLPVTHHNVTDEGVVDAFAQMMDDLPAPILFYCRTGTRCTVLWTQVAARRLGVDRALEVAACAGYDMEVLRDDLMERHGALAGSPAAHLAPSVPAPAA